MLKDRRARGGKVTTRAVVVIAVLLAGAVVGGYLLLGRGASGGASGDTSGARAAMESVSAPTGDLPGWRQVFVTDFPGEVPVGAFSDCNHDVDTPRAECTGLRPYGPYHTDWWAYPSGWPDTATSGADGNSGAPFGGLYRPESTVSVGGGAMHIRMYRPDGGGPNAVAAVVPRACMQRRYGRYSERFRVVHADPGFKSAHLFYQDGHEIDFPENDYGDTISAYLHPGSAAFRTSARWSDWHTTDIEWTPGSVVFRLDGAVIGTATDHVPDVAMSWVLQNESSIRGPYAAPGAWSQLDIDWAACYVPDR